MPDSTEVNERKKLAQSLFSGNELQKALAVYSELCALDETDAQSWHMAGAINGMLGHGERSVYCCRRAVALNPDSYASRLNLGNALMALGQYADAQSELEKALALNQESEEACNSLGNLMFNQQHFEASREFYQRALKINPASADALNNLGVLLYSFGCTVEAIPCFRRALEIDPGNIESRVNAGNALLDTARNDEAEASYRHALAVNPGHPGALAGLGTILERRGQYDEAYTIIQPLIDAGTTNPLVAILFTKLSTHLSREQEAVDLLVRVLKLDTTGTNHRIQLFFALGDLLDSMQRYAEAFDSYRQGNESSNRSFSLAHQQASINNLIEIFSGDFMAASPRSSISSGQLVFIVGMPRSGTSLVEQILASHPDVIALGEVDHIPKIIDVLRDRMGAGARYPACVKQLDEQLLNELSSGHLQAIARQSGKGERVTDKMVQNYLNLGLIEMLFPEAKIIHCTRNPLDVCLSCYFHQFVGSHAYSYDLEDLGNFYLEYERLMRHWQLVSGLSMLEVSYRDMINDHDQVVRSMLEFVGLEWHPDCLRFHESERQVLTASYKQVRQKIYNKSMSRWKNYENNIRPLVEIIARGRRAGVNIEDW